MPCSLAKQKITISKNCNSLTKEAFPPQNRSTIHQNAELTEVPYCCLSTLTCVKSSCS